MRGISLSRPGRSPESPYPDTSIAHFCSNWRGGTYFASSLLSVLKSASRCAVLSLLCGTGAITRRKRSSPTSAWARCEPRRAPGGHGRRARECSRPRLHPWVPSPSLSRPGTPCSSPTGRSKHAMAVQMDASAYQATAPNFDINRVLLHVTMSPAIVDQSAQPRNVLCKKYGSPRMYLKIKKIWPEP